jgi:hypothetical protein
MLPNFLLSQTFNLKKNCSKTSLGANSLLLHQFWFTHFLRVKGFKVSLKKSIGISKKNIKSFSLMFKIDSDRYFLVAALKDLHLQSVISRSIPLGIHSVQKKKENNVNGNYQRFELLGCVCSHQTGLPLINLIPKLSVTPKGHIILS